MSKPEWGTKHLCQSCGAKFYDLQRAPIACPSCGAGVDRESPLKSRRSRNAAAAKPVPLEPVAKPRPVDGEQAEDLAEADLAEANLGDADLAKNIADDSDDKLIEDTSELGDDDVSDVVASTDDDEER